MGVKRIAVARRVSEDTHNAAARFPAYCQRVKERQKYAVPSAGLWGRVCLGTCGATYHEGLWTGRV